MYLRKEVTACEKLHSHFAAPFLNNVDGTEKLKPLQYYMIAY